MLVNFGIHALAASASAALGWRLARLQGASRECGISVAGICALIYIWNNEALYSHGVIYWGHSLFQVFWPLQLICLTFFLREKYLPKVPWALLIVLFIFSFLGPATEWSGYVANAGIVILCIFANIKRKCDLNLVIITVIAASLLAFVMFVLPFALTVDLRTLFITIVHRINERSALKFPSINHGLFFLLVGYVESYGLYLLLTIGIVAFLVRYQLKDKNKMSEIIFSPFIWLVLVIFPLLENLAMLQHAFQYTFDRLKFIFVIIVAIALYFPKLTIRGKKLFLFAISCCIFFTVIQFLIVTKVIATCQIDNSWTSHAVKIYRRVWPIPKIATNSNLISRVTFPDAIYATPFNVRGYVNISMHRGVYENVKSIIQLDKIMQSRHARLGVWLLGTNYGWNMYGWRQAIVRDAARDTVVIIGVMSLDEAREGAIVVTHEAFPFFKQASSLMVNEEIIPIKLCDANSSRIFIGQHPKYMDAPMIYSVNLTK